MSLNQLNTSNSLWSKSICELSSNPKKPTQSIEKLIASGLHTIEDLIWIFPLRIQEAPKIKAFNLYNLEELVLGEGTIISVSAAPAFGRRGKGRMQLFNLKAQVRDLHSCEILTLRFFNAYPNMVKSIKKDLNIKFMGKLQDYKGDIQIVNPKLNPKDISDENGLLIEYPTIASVPGTYLKKLIRKISPEIFNEAFIPSGLEKLENIQDINYSLKIIHGLVPSNKEERDKAKNAIIYYEFLSNQLKIKARRKKFKNKIATKFETSNETSDKLTRYFPYNLTVDQLKVWSEITEDLNSGHPMMRLIQGDVGCGKTTLAIMSSFLIAQKKSQVALMCPTESLARQHYENFSDVNQDKFSIELLLGSTKAKEKKEIYQKLNNGEIDIIIGTHSLIQESVEFKSLQLAIIDEQHKFGVSQRIKLLDKGSAVHCMIMSATPIPRTLQLSQFGDLDISTISTMPTGRKGIKTRIVEDSTYEKYLSFLKTRISLGEQAYVVVPIIEESETLNLNNVKSIEQSYKKYFPEYKVATLHGKLKPEEKEKVLNDFQDKKIHILISTTVIEVGINIINATVMSIYNPERFGLSSLHQLRGRVGRGEKIGFCFLVTHKNISPESKERLKILEETNDGFKIAQADLENRGEGDLFGESQSGTQSNTKIASIFKHYDLFNQVNEDLNKFETHHSEIYEAIIEQLLEDKNISTTI
jgi:ATP-dependent DNA helicase RecG